MGQHVLLIFSVFCRGFRHFQLWGKASIHLRVPHFSSVEIFGDKGL